MRYKALPDATKKAIVTKKDNHKVQKTLKNTEKAKSRSFHR
jgi:hypothetical protein